MSSTDKIVFFEGVDVQMQPCPVNPAWVIEGKPVARNFILSESSDGGALTLLWDCTAGVFNWHYNIDETVYVLEGSAIIRTDDGLERRIGPGDQVLFREGSHAIWRVESYIRKVAFCRNPVPKPLMFASRALRKIGRMTGLIPSSDSGPMFSGA